MPTLADVARHANVSKMTVSRVINHPEKVTQELRNLVTKAMKEIGYEPNYIAQSLVNNRTRVVRYIVSEDIDTTEPYYMNLLAGISKGLAKKYYSLQLIYDDNWEVGKVDGIIYTGIKNEDLTLIAEVSEPIVIFGENASGLDFVDVDNRASIHTVVEHMLSEGATRIIYFGINRPELFARMRQQGYEDCMQKKRMPLEIYNLENSSRSAATCTSLLKNLPQQKTAIICATDRIALGVVRMLSKQRVKIGVDVLVSGFDGVFLDQIAEPKLTTLKQPLITMGERLAQIIITKIENPKTKAEPQIMEYYEAELIIRASTKKLG
ncbi:d-gluconate inducible gluconate regulon transcriptional repressor [Erysipelotrichaceae bacterium]|nr:d-gluconate inducible gluconate regulon transcriptional repressor [Erysipelotrichaceae bacterium]